MENIDLTQILTWLGWIISALTGLTFILNLIQSIIK